MYQHNYYTYILASNSGTLYIGVTNDLERRISEHKQGLIEGFTNKYDVKKLVYYETYQYIYDAIYREKCIKRWKREWKINLIEAENPNWEDLYRQFT